MVSYSSLSGSPRSSSAFSARDARARLDAPHARPLGADRRRLGVVLVVDVADDDLEQVLDRADADGAAVLVDDDREVRLLGLELDEQVARLHRLGDVRRRVRERGDRLAAVGLARRLQDVEHVDDADDVVDARRGRSACASAACRRSRARPRRSACPRAARSPRRAAPSARRPCTRRARRRSRSSRARRRRSPACRSPARSRSAARARRA